MDTSSYPGDRRVVDLDDPLATDPTVVGAKAAVLADLRARGVEVPPGVVLPAALLAEWRGHEPTAAIRDAVSRAVERLGDVPLAVRSSALGEDAVGASFAGQFATVLDVRGEPDVIDALRSVLASAGAPQVARYRGGGDDGPPAIPMAVLIQPMLAPTAAGVAFTADPVTGDRDAVRIAAATGRGDAVADGSGEPEEWRVERGVPERTHDAPAGSVLTSAMVGAVDRAAQEVAELLAMPLDIEWALVDDRVQVLQARPITVLPTPPATTLEGDGWQKDLAHYPEQLTPFGASVHTSEMMTATTDFLADFGLLVKDLEVAVVGGEVYARPVPVVGGAEPPPFDPPAWLLGLLARVVPALRSRTRIAERVVAEGRMEATVRRWWDEWRPALLDRLEAERRIDPASLGDGELLEYLDRLLDLVAHGQYVHFQLFLPYLVPLHELAVTCHDLLGWDEPRTMRLLAGASPASVAGVAELDQLAADVAERPGAAAALRGRPGDPVTALAAADPALAERLATWLDTHGWRTTGYDPGSVAWAERPGLVTPVLLAGSTERTGGAAAAAAAEVEALGLLRGAAPQARQRFQRDLDAARAVHPVREDNTVLTDSLPSGLLRRWLVEAGHRLVDRGVLARADDASFATLDELAVALGGAPPDDLGGRIARRRGEHAWVRAHPGPAYVGRQGAPPDVSALPPAARRLNGALLWAMQHEYPPPREDQVSDALLTGVAAAPGRHIGPVRVIRREREFSRLRPGDVLVCPVTTPAWTYLFATAGAVVADGGGSLSHTSIVAREHGLPAVVGTGDATTSLRDGQVVEVDGTTGEVFPA